MEHSYVYETPTNSTTYVASTSATASVLHHRQMTRERQVEQDTILGGHIPDGRQRSTDSLPSYCSSSLYSEQGMLS
jgi:hypothetical protein